ncbi:MAG TPA: amino acid adenylation domain-containing protein [Longimicrobium sp.]|nr:amino acid adenylation domain-containing protein [Longimicrobium sp.]
MSQAQDRIAHLTPAQRRVLLHRMIRERDGASEETIPRRAGDGPVPLSFAQARLWFIDQLEPGTYTYTMLYSLRLRGPLDAAALGRAFTALVARHEVLRTVFAAPGGEPVQVVLPPAPVPLPRVDLRGLPAGEAEARARRIAAAEARRPFDLARGPMLRTTLARLGDREHVLVFALHHIVADGLSVEVLVREVSAAYEAYAAGREPGLPPLPLQYADFAVWQRARLTDQVVAAQVAYWRERLAGAPPLLEIPTDRPRAPGLSQQAGVVPFTLPATTAGALRELGRREGATLFMVILAAWQALLSRYSGQADVVVGAPVGGRPRVELEGLIGMFVNTLVLRTDLGGDPTFTGLLGRVRETTLGAYQHQDLPFERLVDELGVERSLTHSPVVQVTCAVERAPAGDTRPSLGPISTEPLGVGAANSVTSLDLRVVEQGDALGGELAYHTALFDAETARRLLGHFRTLLREAAADPGRRLSALSLMDDEERHRVLVAWNDTAAPADPVPLHARVSARAARTPEAPAVVHEGETVAYGALEARANRLAHRLRAMGVGPGVRVGVCLERTPGWVVTVLAVLKAGGVYVPLDPQYPAERLGYMLEDCGAPLLLTRSALLARLPAFAGRVVCLDREGGAAGEPAGPPAVETPPDEVAYLIYTSGSTGRPKGVMITHGGVSNLIDARHGLLGGEAGGHVFQFASAGFDASVWEMGLAFGSGAVLHLPPAGAFPAGAELLAILRDGAITAVTLPPSTLATLPAEPLPALGVVVVAGEACGAELVRRWGQGRRFVNAYGPTETTVCATAARVRAGEHGASLPIGRPLANVQAYVLDAAGAPAPIGVPGELHVGGAGVARGYQGRPALTAERFVPDPFGGRAGARLYRTGDRARWLASGELEFLGRVDHQVKLRGFRVEPGEVEATLRAQPGVADAAVVMHDGRLAAYVVAAGEPPSAAALRDALALRLPDYMVPAGFVFLDALPQTRNGKLDRAALPAPGWEDAVSLHAAPRTPTEEILAGIWAELLDWVEGDRGRGIGVHDSFFALGGHSLLATQVVARVQQVFGVEVPLRILFEAPTVAELAARVDEAVGAGVEAWEVEEEMDRLARLSDEEVQALLRDG